MKGIINKGIEEMVIAEHGDATWARIKKKAGVEEPFFAISLDYSDESTRVLIRTVAEELGTSARQAMVAYGRWTVTHTLKRHYPTFIQLAGSEPRRFLLNMNKVHEMVTRSLVNSRPPAFEYEERDGDLLMRYRSERQLCAVLEGLILGVGDLFGQELDVEALSCMLEGAESCDMLVRFP